jgi:protein-S-isoprenylcysteine O-methyltransferase Ste14
MADGLILLAFIGVLVALFVTRVQKRMRIASTAKTWYMIITGVVLAGLVLWAWSLQK